MPVHRLSRAEFESALDAIQHTERVVSAWPEGEGSYVVVTEVRKPARGEAGQKETRA